ncbi:MAG: DUF4878 domain-containing protein [Bacteroidales bacterium]|jgi:hypothetical protein|nr:DUF4878 domain-containing protein [Bacteroidales bacterium]
MKKLALFLAAAVFAVFAISCGGGNSPKNIEKKIAAQLEKGNYEQAVTVMFENLDTDGNEASELTPEQMKEFAKKLEESNAAKGGIKSVEVLSETIAEDGKTATVESKTTYGDGTEETQTTNYVKKEDGTWKMSINK